MTAIADWAAWLEPRYKDLIEVAIRSDPDKQTSAWSSYESWDSNPKPKATDDISGSGTKAACATVAAHVGETPVVFSRRPSSCCPKRPRRPCKSAYRDQR